VKRLASFIRVVQKISKKRFTEHNQGKVTSTKSGCPWNIIYYEAFTNKTDALREELFLKSGKGKERIKYLFND